MSQVATDLAIVGAGPVGATLALSIAGIEASIVVLDARAKGETLRGDRSLALSHGARLIYERLGVWPDLSSIEGAVTPITDIDISQAGGFGMARLSASDQQLPALGYVISYRALQAALDAAIARAGIAVRHGVTVTDVGGTSAYAAVIGDGAADVTTARLAAVADGSGSAVGGVERKRHAYGQVALVARVWQARPHRGLAYERFTPQGPVALLPEGDHYGLVWTATPERAQALIALEERAFLDELARHFGTRTAAFTQVEDRRSFPLALEYASTATATRCVMLGNAAQALHPVAGQGFNLGLRDAAELAAILRDTPREAFGEPPMLRRYERQRRGDRYAGIAFTHGLVAAFGSDNALLRWPRGLALTLLDALPPVRRAFTRAMLFGMR